MNENILFFDIETEVHSDALQYMDDPTPPSNYKTEEAITKYITEKKAEMVEKAALDPDYGRISAISMLFDSKKITMITSKPETLGDYKPAKSSLDSLEAAMIRRFWDELYVYKNICCGYNILSFDLPYLMRRSFDLGIRSIPIHSNELAKYRTMPVLDLMAVLFNWGQAKSLKWVAKRYGLKNPLPDLDGSMYAMMDEETRIKYVENDVNLVVQLYEKMAGIYF